MTLDEIAKLSRWKVNNIYFRPRNEENKLIRREDTVPEKSVATDQSQFWTRYIGYPTSEDSFLTSTR